MKNFEIRDKTQANHTLSMISELRADDKDEGIISGYCAVWSQIDAYNSKFQRGAFKKTIQNRLDKIKVLYNHDTEKPIGKLLEIEEDSHGLRIKAQLIMDVESVRDTFNLIKGGAINAFSFGFRTLKDKFENGIQVITEVALGEVSPVIFPAGEASLITDARSTDFVHTDKKKELWQSRYRLLESLTDTLDDILWSESDESIQMSNDAIDAFKNAYMVMMTELKGSQYRNDNKLTLEFRKYCKDKNLTLEQIALTSSLTIDELSTLKRGGIITDALKLIDFPDALKNAHQEVRNKKVESLCDSLRDGLSEAEATRINALLEKSLPKIEADNDIKSFFNDFHRSLK